MKYLKEYREFNHEFTGINEQEGIWDKFKKTVLDFFTSKPSVVDKKPKTAKTIDVINGPHMLYLPHQQGPTGAAKLVNIIKGKEKLDSTLRGNMLNNMPSSYPGYNTVKTGKDKDAVTAFLMYQKDTWKKLESEALKEIKDPKNAKVKEALFNIRSSEFPNNFLTTVAYKESRFDPNPKSNPSFKGLFQIGDSAWQQLKKIDPQKYKGSKPPLKVTKNVEAGYDYMKWAYEQFEKNLK
jgi:hypothetical protein